MIHQIRKRNHHKNAVVHGVLSDGYQFDFLRLDNENKVR